MKYKKVNSFDGSPDGLPQDMMFRQDSMPCGSMLDGSPKPLDLAPRKIYPYYTGMPSAVTSVNPAGFPYQQPYYNDIGLDAVGQRPADTHSLALHSSPPVSLPQQKYVNTTNNNMLHTYQQQHHYNTHYYNAN